MMMVPFLRRSAVDSESTAGNVGSSRRRRRRRLVGPAKLWRKPGSSATPEAFVDSPAGKSQQTLFTSSSTFSEYSTHAPGEAHQKLSDDGIRARPCGDTFSVRPFPLLEVNVDVDETSTTAGIGDNDEENEWENWNDGHGTVLPGNDTGCAFSYRRAQSLAESCEYDLALVAAEEGIDLSVASQAPDRALLGSLMMLKANILGRMGCYRRSLACYQSLLRLTDATERAASISLADRANVLYACGRLCESMKDYTLAIDFYKQELIATIDFVGSDAHPSVSRIRHQIAHVYKEGLGELSSSLEYLKLALQSETACLGNAEKARASCPDCRKHLHCPAHQEEIQQAQQQVRETKRRMGRIHYELGDLNQAIRLTLN
jgi:tetratricopeptide (TPR) repeat protein